MTSKGKRYKASSKSVRKIWFVLSRMTKRIWFRSSVYAIIAILTAFVSYFGKFYISETLVTKIGSDSVGNVLTILASSMLAVATFSLSIMISAFGQVASGATPRAASLLVEDQKSQSAVATFIGAFLYSIVGLITLSTGIYGVSGRFLLFVVTICVIIWIIATLIRWVDQLATLGRVGDTIKKIEVATSQALLHRASLPYLGGRPHELMTSGFSVVGAEIGFVCFIDIQALNALAEKLDVQISLEILPGSFIYPGRALACVSRGLSRGDYEEMASHVIIEASRSFQQDPRFGFITLTEIASRALSPAVNDPGTAIEVMGACVRLLSQWSLAARENSLEPKEILYSRVAVKPIENRDLLLDVFGPIARDGASIVEIGIKLQRSLKALSEFDPIRFAQPAKEVAAIALLQSNEKLPTEFDRDRVRKVLATN